MRHYGNGLLIFAVFALTTGAEAQDAAATNQSIIRIGQASGQAPTRKPIQVPDGFLESAGAQMKFARGPQLPAETLMQLQRMGTNAVVVNNEASEAAAVSAAKPAPTLETIPFWTGSFTFQSVNFPFSMVGGNPADGGTTRIKNAIIPVSLVFDEFMDANGNPIVFDVTPTIGSVLNSPNFEKATYETGFTQFSDAIQRAEFWNIPQAQGDWHTLLRKPRLLTPVRVEVPAGLAVLFQHANGAVLAIVNSFFFMSQVNTIEQLEPLKDDEIGFILTSNTVLGGSATDCCIIGFHTAIDEGVQGNKHSLQILAFASYLSPGDLGGGLFTDVTAISHEYAEVFDDPFMNNVVPKWLMSGNNPPNCENLLETGEIIDPLSNPNFPVTIDGFTYHPQTQALLQWFARTSPSNAIDGAYSFPDETVLTSPSSPCP